MYKGYMYIKNQWINVMLDRFSIFEFYVVFDFSGVYIVFDKFVGVFSGNRKVVVGNIGGLCDYLVEMLFLVFFWGKNYVIVLIFERVVGDIFQFFVSEDNIYVNVLGVINGKVFYDYFIILKVGMYVKKEYDLVLYFYIIFDKLILVF